LAKPTPPRGACGPSRTALQPPSCNRSATPPGLAHVAVGCSISSAPHVSAPLLYTRTPYPYSPAASHFQHSALAPLSRGSNTNAAPPPASPLPSAAHEALRAQQRRAGGQGGDEFISETKRNVKRRRARRGGDIQRDCEAGEAS
jgi:hypothetical protein